MTAQATKLQLAKPVPAVPVGAVVATCTLKKTRPAATRSRAISLPRGTQASVETAWLRRLSGLEPEVATRALYAGRGYRLADQAARLANAPIYIVSAGLGLVAGDTFAPAYGLTLEGKQADAVANRVVGTFDASLWFDAMLRGPFSGAWTDAFSGEGLVLVALTHPYARMVGASLAALPTGAQARLRLFGRSLTGVLPEILHAAIAPYDQRLDAISPGLLQHFSSRALLHFVQAVLPGSPQSRASEFAAVEMALAAVTAPHRPRRPTRTDAEIRGWLVSRLVCERGVAKLLSALRHEEGIACEQARFTRLYRAALEERAAA